MDVVKLMKTLYDLSKKKKFEDLPVDVQMEEFKQEKDLVTIENRVEYFNKVEKMTKRSDFLSIIGRLNFGYQYTILKAKHNENKDGSNLVNYIQKFHISATKSNIYRYIKYYAIYLRCPMIFIMMYYNYKHKENNVSFNYLLDTIKLKNLIKVLDYRGELQKSLMNEYLRIPSDYRTKYLPILVNSYEITYKGIEKEKDNVKRKNTSTKKSKKKTKCQISN
eukprot:TRINITY_DN4103_c0_g1_i1.p2 TRINITY_DN4103_c0_g1~~TRINITY_DN4103_c0_g1_i1.p2  ORF type:complete len:221 (-),score=42.58 TRINITY_DN4103_c0_g1_i1:871-1533(-)